MFSLDSYRYHGEEDVHADEREHINTKEGVSVSMITCEIGLCRERETETETERCIRGERGVHNSEMSISCKNVWKQ